MSPSRRSLAVELAHLKEMEEASLVTLDDEWITATPRGG
jgi:hypothetical protein